MYILFKIKLKVLALICLAHSLFVSECPLSLAAEKLRTVQKAHGLSSLMGVDYLRGKEWEG